MGESGLSVIVIFWIVFAFAWYLLGWIFFCYYEDLTAIDGFYFTTVTVTTVGYGVIVPSTRAGRVIAAVYMLIPLHEVGSSQVRSLVFRVAISCGIISTWICVGTIIGTFSFNFNGWDALYWSITTLTTVGYGDFVPSSPSQRAVGGLFVLFGTTCFALSVSQLMAIVVATSKQREVIEFLKPPITRETLMKIDPEYQDASGGITKGAYLKFMLIKCGFIDPEVIRDLEKSFDILDVDHNGVLDEEDMQNKFDFNIS